MSKILINGISGRMGLELISVIEKDESVSLLGGIDVKPVAGRPDISVASNPDKFGTQADVVIDFSLPAPAEKILEYCLGKKIPLVTGTTGISDGQMKKYKAASENIPIVQAFNFSIGINLLLNLVANAAEVLKNKADIEIIEAHHRNKKDSPSGTALMLAEWIASSLKISTEGNLQFGRHGKTLDRTDEIGIHSVRGGSVIGEHQVLFLGENENLSLRHQALNRQIFADGALIAAKWVADKKSGYFTMQKVLGF